MWCISAIKHDLAFHSSKYRLMIRSDLLLLKPWSVAVVVHICNQALIGRRQICIWLSAFRRGCLDKATAFRRATKTPRAKAARFRRQTWSRLQSTTSALGRSLPVGTPEMDQADRWGGEQIRRILPPWPGQAPLGWTRRTERGGQKIRHVLPPWPGQSPLPPPLAQSEPTPIPLTPLLLL